MTTKLAPFNPGQTYPLYVNPNSSDRNRWYAHGIAGSLCVMQRLQVSSGCSREEAVEAATRWAASPTHRVKWEVQA